MSSCHCARPLSGALLVLLVWVGAGSVSVAQPAPAAAPSTLKPQPAPAAASPLKPQPAPAAASPLKPQPAPAAASPFKPQAAPGAQPAAAAAPGATPWAGAAVPVAPPGFLDTADKRIKDERPAPTPQQVAALKELENEANNFTKIGGSYRDTLVALLQREYLRKRYSQDQGYMHQVDAEEALEDKARLSAIELFERFLAKYPNDPRYAPDAMFRLGELYF
ncbi:MAG TPA: hypothetical protein VF331_04580, partial [Polyangiales bacterium]